MKNLKRSLFPAIFIALAVLSQSTIFANNTNPSIDHSRLMIQKVDEASFKMRIVNLEKERTFIYLKDSEGNQIYSKDIINSNAYFSSFDLSKLENGTYFFHINRTKKDYIQTIQLTDEGIITGDLKEIIRPDFQIKKDRFTISQALVNVTEVVIYDKKDQVVYKSDFVNATKDDLRFNIANLTTGDYTVAIKTVDSIYFEQLNVQ